MRTVSRRLEGSAASTRDRPPSSLLGCWFDSSVTKLLHLKRPRLVPVVDSYVAKAVGQRLRDEKPKPERAAQARMVIEHLRDEGVRLRPGLEAIQGHLAVAELPVNRSRARILDVLLWTSEDPGFKAIGEMLVRWRAEDEANDH